MKGEDKSLNVGAGDDAAPEVVDWLRHRLPDWPRIWGSCLRRTRSWPVPPRWSPRDWWDELDAEGIASTCTALRNFDPIRGPTLGSFVYHQILSDALTRYRKDWSYTLGGRPGRDTTRECATSAVEEPSVTDVDSRSLRDLVERLVEDDRILIECLFWDGWIGSRVASSTRIRHRAALKRRQKILQALGCRPSGHIEL
jgi:hypothetical protein